MNAMSERHKLLWDALSTRVLTPDEMDEILQYGPSVMFGTEFRMAEPIKEEKVFNEGLFLQFRMRLEEERKRKHRQCLIRNS